MKKISWGTGIVIAFIIFIIFTLSTTFYLMNQDVDLVTEDYYDKEIKYQQQIDILKRTALIEDEVNLTVAQEFLNVQFNDSLLIFPISGSFHFYRPSDAKKDITIPLQLSEEGIQAIPLSRLDRGYWKVKFNWKINETEYYKEQTLHLE